MADNKNKTKEAFEAFKASAFNFVNVMGDEIKNNVNNLDKEDAIKFVNSVKAKMKEGFSVIGEWANDLATQAFISNVDKMSRKQCVEFIKIKHLKPTFDVEEASGDELREYIKSLKNDFNEEEDVDSKTEDDKKPDWRQKIKNFYKFEKDENPLTNPESEEIKVNVENEDSQSVDETEIKINIEDDKSMKKEIPTKDISEFEKEFKDFLNKNGLREFFRTL